jgi:hypothetical protein
MFSDYIEQFSEKELNKLQEDCDDFRAKRLKSFQKKNVERNVTKKDFEEIIHQWNIALQMNYFAWAYPENNPPWAIQSCKEFDACIGGGHFDNIFEKFMSQMSTEDLFDYMYNIYLNQVV